MFSSPALYWLLVVRRWIGWYQNTDTYGLGHAEQQWAFSVCLVTARYLRSIYYSLLPAQPPTVTVVVNVS
jgi:hypothetical protein